MLLFDFFLYSLAIIDLSNRELNFLNLDLYSCL